MTVDPGGHNVAHAASPVQESDSLEGGDGYVGLGVVVPTTHRVREVEDLVRRVEATSPTRVKVVVVDNGPRASAKGWRLPPTCRLLILPDYQGSEAAFLAGASALAAYSPGRLLFLDHDAVLEDTTIKRLLAAATDTGSVYSANQGGDCGCWDRWWGNLSPRRELTAPEAVALAPWSGLLVPHQAVATVVSQSSGYWFTWDDALLSHRLRLAGFRIVGVPDAVLHNERREGDYLLAWRAYYGSRNHILFCRDLGSGNEHLRMDQVLGIWAKFFLGALTRRQWGRAWAIASGVVDGILDRRGARWLPNRS